MRDVDLATCTSALAALRASTRAPEDIKQCISVVLPLVRKASGSDAPGRAIAELLRAGRIDAAQRLLEGVTGRAQSSPPCPGCRGMTQWQSPAGCPDCGYKSKSLSSRVTFFTLVLGPFIALMLATAGAALVPSTGALAAPFVCSSGEEIVTKGAHFEQPDGTRGTTYTSVCRGPNGTTPVSNLTMMGVLTLIYLLPSLIVAALPAFLLARRLRALGR